MKFRNQIFIVFFGLILFIPFLGKVHLFDWDEINFAEAAREMIVTGDYLKVRIDFEPFHEKPPLFIWMQVASMKIFGVNEFAARFPNAIIGIITLLIVYSIGKLLFDEKFGLLWVLSFVGSYLPHFYFKTGIIDPTFNLLMYLSLFYLFKYFHLERSNKNILFAALFNSLSILTKGPVGFLLVFLSWGTIWIYNRKKQNFPLKEIIIFSISSFIPLILWYLVVALQTGGDIINEFFVYQIRLLTTNDAGHGGPFYYHFIVLLIGCFPASIFVIRAFLNQASDNEKQAMFKYWNFALFAVVLIIFSIVKTKIVHYSSLAYFPITFLSAYSLHKILKGEIKWKISSNIFIGIIGVVFSLLLMAFPLILMNIDLFLPKITDKFTHALLMANPKWYGFEWMIGLILLISLIIFYIFIYKKDFLKAFLTLFSGTLIVIFLFLPLIAPNVEKYSQAAPVEFYKSLKNRDVYTYNLGYKSYAPYFYGLRKFENSRYFTKKNFDDYENWLLFGEIDKDVYFSVKNTALDSYIAKGKDLILLYTKNGFVFLKRNAN